MPAVQYNYEYYNATSRDQARFARSSRASSAVSTRTYSQPTTTPRKKQNHASIDVPVMVKKKVEFQKPEEMKLHKTKVSSKNREKVEGKKRAIIFTTLAISALLFVCVRYTLINEKFNELNSLEKKVSSAVALNEQLSSEIDSKTDLTYIERYAKYQLGMQKPVDSQIVRIAYDKKDKISKPFVIAENKQDDFLTRLLNDLKNIID